MPTVPNEPRSTAAKTTATKPATTKTTTTDTSKPVKAKKRTS